MNTTQLCKETHWLWRELFMSGRHCWLHLPAAFPEGRAQPIPLAMVLENRGKRRKESRNDPLKSVSSPFLLVSFTTC
jgi:hypothetical protein